MAHTIHVFRVGMVFHCPVGEVPGDTPQEAVDALMAKFVATGQSDGGLEYHQERDGHIIFAVANDDGTMRPIIPTEVQKIVDEASATPKPGEVDVDRLNAMWGDDEEEDDDNTSI